MLSSLYLLPPALQANLLYTWQMPWLSTMGFTAGLYFDSLSALFALLILGVGLGRSAQGDDS